MSNFAELRKYMNKEQENVKLPLYNTYIILFHF